jgi:hypothetical protein
MKNLKQTLTIAIMAIATTAIQAQVKIGANPTVITPNTNLEVEATNGQKMVVNKDNGFVGIGTPISGYPSAPMTSLDVSQFTNNIIAYGYQNSIGVFRTGGAGGAVVVGSITGNTSYIGTNSASTNGLSLYTNGKTDRTLWMNNDGNVFIGEPNYILTTKATLEVFQKDGTGMNAYNYTNAIGIFRTAGSGGAVVLGSINGNSSYIASNAESTNGLKLFTNGITTTPLVQLTNTQLVGIGTASPDCKLSVVGSAPANVSGYDNSIANFKIGPGTGSIVLGSITGNTAYIGTSTESSNGLSFFVNGTTSTAPIWISNNSNVKIGSDNYSIPPKVKFDVLGYIKVGSSDATGDATPVPGMIRYNSTTDKFEGYTTTGWVNLN